MLLVCDMINNAAVFPRIIVQHKIYDLIRNVKKGKNTTQKYHKNVHENAIMKHCRTQQIKTLRDVRSS